MYSSLKTFSGRFYYLLAALLASLPISIFLTNLLGIILLLHCATASKQVWKQGKLLHPLPLLFQAFFMIYALSLLWSSGSDGLAEVAPKTAFLIMPIPLALGIPQLSHRQLQILKLVFCAGVSIAAIVAIFFSFLRYTDTGSWYVYWPDGSVKQHLLFYTGLAEPVMHPGYFSVYTGSSIFLLWQQRKGFPTQLPFALWLGFLLIFLIMLQGRMNLIAFALVIGFYLVYLIVRQKSFSKLWTSTALVASLLVIIAVVRLSPDSVKERFSPSLSMEYDISSPSMESFTGFTVRLAEWKCAAEVIENNFWLGTGVGDSKEALQQSYRNNNFVVGLKHGYNAHNQYLQTWIATGLPGIAILLSTLLVLLISAYKQQDVYLAMTVLFFFFSMITESMLVRHWGVSFMCSLLLALALATGPKKPVSR